MKRAQQLREVGRCAGGAGGKAGVPSSPIAGSKLSPPVNEIAAAAALPAQFTSPASAHALVTEIAYPSLSNKSLGKPRSLRVCTLLIKFI